LYKDLKKTGHLPPEIEALIQKLETVLHAKTNKETD